MDAYIAGSSLVTERNHDGYSRRHIVISGKRSGGLELIAWKDGALSVAPKDQTHNMDVLSRDGVRALRDFLTEQLNATYSLAELFDSLQPPPAPAPEVAILRQVRIALNTPEGENIVEHANKIYAQAQPRSPPVDRPGPVNAAGKLVRQAGHKYQLATSNAEKQVACAQVAEAALRLQKEAEKERDALRMKPTTSPHCMWSSTAAEVYPPFSWKYERLF